MPPTKVFVLVNGQRLAFDQAGADAVGALSRLAPVSAQPQPGLLEAAPLGRSGDAIEDHTTGIGEQHRMAGTGKLLVQAVHFLIGDLQHLAHAFAAFQQAAMLEDHRGFGQRGIQMIVLQAAQPGAGNGRVAAAFDTAAMGDRVHLPGMPGKWIALHYCGSPQIEAKASILHSRPVCNAPATRRVIDGTQCHPSLYRTRHIAGGQWALCGANCLISLKRKTMAQPLLYALHSTQTQ